MFAKLTAGGAILVLLVSGCTDREAEARHAREEAEAKARAEAARREAEAIPKAFKPREYFKKNEPEKKPDSSAATPKPTL